MEITINLPDELYQKVVNATQKQKISVEEFIVSCVHKLVLEETRDFHAKTN
jgi:metal-responsive CopG/Arc/MetJ family transcriptional regulator